MNKSIILAIILFNSLSFAGEVTLTTTEKNLKLFSKFNSDKTLLKNEDDLVAIKVDSNMLESIAESVHGSTHRCGGFVTSFENKIFNEPAQDFSKFFNEYSISKESLVNNFISQADESRVLEFIKYFSSYHTRSSKTQMGVQALIDLSKKWEKLIEGVSYAKVELFKHKNFDQPSVIVTFKGQSDDRIIVGGHGDSINTDDSNPHAHAPGADDNASGISVITEIIRILSVNRYQPENTIEFIAYAAEEVGLLGSMEISQKYLEENIVVKGVLNLDGTNFQGSPDLGMILYKDHTSPEQNTFLASLIDTYVKVPWEYDNCGYACSDHYSWKYRGFAASFPAEARLREENSLIHTSKDTLEVSNNSASHSMGFVKLGIAYVLEMDK